MVDCLSARGLLMHIGIDFGTSYSAAAAIIDGELTLVRFGEAEQFRTAVYFPELVPDPNDFELTPELEAQLEAHIRSARTELRRQATAGVTASRSDEALRRDALRVGRPQWMEEPARAGPPSIPSLQHALFGKEPV